MKKIFRDERGFMLLNVVFLTLITSLAAMILFNAAPRARTPNSTLRLTALYLANERFAYLESLAAGNPVEENLLGESVRTSTNFGESIEFKVKTEFLSAANPRKVKVTVSWLVNEKENSVEVERTIYFVENS